MTRHRRPVPIVSAPHPTTDGTHCHVYLKDSGEELPLWALQAPDGSWWLEACVPTFGVQTMPRWVEDLPGVAHPAAPARPVARFATVEDALASVLPELSGGTGRTLSELHRWLSPTPSTAS